MTAFARVVSGIFGLAWMVSGASVAQAQSAAPSKAVVEQTVKRYVEAANREVQANQETVEASQTEVADLNGDGKPEIILWSTLLGPTYWSHGIVVFGDRGRGYEKVAETKEALGMVERIALKNGLIEVRAKWPAPGDPRCCPTQNRITSYRLDGARLVKAGRDKAPIPEGAGPGRPSGRSAWELRTVAGRPPVATVEGPGVVRSLSLMCNEGRAVLALVVRAKPPLGALTLSLVVGGRTMNLPLVQGSTDGKLLLADVSKSALPRLLAQYGRGTATLRINGGLQGPLRLDGVSAASRVALADCYRY